MAYPTTLKFKPSSTQIGLPQFDTVDTVQALPLGTKMRHVDPTYGDVELVYLKGVASTAKGDIVTYDAKNGVTVRSVAASRGPLAVAMAATVANTFGWYAVAGIVPVSTTLAGTGAANSLLQVTATAGQATVSGTAAVKIDGALCKSAQDAPGAGFTDVLLAYPSANGNT